MSEIKSLKSSDDQILKSLKEGLLSVRLGKNHSTAQVLSGLNSRRKARNSSQSSSQAKKLAISDKI